MGIAEKNNAQLYQHNGLTPNGINNIHHIVEQAHNRIQLTQLVYMFSSQLSIHNYTMNFGILYIANCLRWKKFAVVELSCYSLEDISGYSSLWPDSTSHRGVYHCSIGKVLQLPINLQKLLNISTSNNLFYIHGSYMHQ